MNKGKTLQYLSYERALAIKYQLGSLIYLLRDIAQDGCDRQSHDQLHGIAELLEGVRSQTDDLMQALDSPPELMAYEAEIKGAGVDLCSPSLAAIVKEASANKKAG